MLGTSVTGRNTFLRRLGAEVLESDPSALTLNGMLDIRKLDWSEEVCQAAGIDLTRLPQVGKPGTMVGRLSKAAAEETKLPAGIALCRGGGDQQCAAVGAGVIRQGLAEVTIGTAAMMVAHLEDPETRDWRRTVHRWTRGSGQMGRRRRRLLHRQLLKMVARQFRPDRAHPSRAGGYEASTT